MNYDKVGSSQGEAPKYRVDARLSLPNWEGYQTVFAAEVYTFDAPGVFAQRVQECIAEAMEVDKSRIDVKLASEMNDREWFYVSTVDGSYHLTSRCTAEDPYADEAEDENENEGVGRTTLAQRVDTFRRLMEQNPIYHDLPWKMARVDLDEVERGIAAVTGVDELLGMGPETEEDRADIDRDPNPFWESALERRTREHLEEYANWLEGLDEDVAANIIAWIEASVRVPGFEGALLDLNDWLSKDFVIGDVLSFWLSNICFNGDPAPADLDGCRALVAAYAEDGVHDRMEEFVAEFDQLPADLQAALRQHLQASGRDPEFARQIVEFNSWIAGMSQEEVDAFWAQLGQVILES